MLIIEGGQLFDPAPRGRATVVAAGGLIEAVGEMNAGALTHLLGAEVIDASRSIVVPGLIDSHAHLIGGSGENGFSSQSAPIDAVELLSNGITTVVGTLGTDTTTKTPAALLARVKALREEGINALMWTGGYDGRPITQSIRDDIILIAEIIGAGEIAIADRRAIHLDAASLTRLASDCHVAGLLTRKAGVLHLHTGELPERLGMLRELLERGIPPATLHPTHVSRNKDLLREAAELTRYGVPVDLDLVDENLPASIRAFDGDRNLMTLSSDAPIGSVDSILRQIRELVQQRILPLEEALALATSNPARILKINDAGEIAVGRRADLLLLDPESLEIQHVICGGKIVREQTKSRAQ